MLEKRNRKEIKALDRKAPGNPDEMGGEIGNTMGEVGRQITRGLESAGTVGESILGVVQSLRRLRGASSKPESLVKVSLTQAELEWLDLLVETRIMESRAEAAIFFITEGIKTRQKQLDFVAQKAREGPRGN